MEQTQQTTEKSQSLAIYENGLQEVQNGKKLLLKHEAAIARAEMVGNKLLAQIENNGGKLNPELDATCNQFLAKCNQQKKLLMEERAPVTQLLDVIKKLFTAMEAKMDVAKGPIPKRIMELRQQYADEIHRAEIERKRKEEEERAKAVELAELLAEATKQLKQTAIDKAAGFIQAQQENLSKSTLENVVQVAQKIKDAMAVRYTEKAHMDFQPNLRFNYVDPGVFETEWTLAIRPKMFTGLKLEIDTMLRNGIEHILDKVPSHIAFLNEQANANEAEAKRLQEARIARELAEKEEVEAKAKEMKLEVANEAKMDAQAGAITSMFNQTVSDEVLPEARTGYDIKVMIKDGYAELFAFWMQNEGLALTDEAIEKMTIGRMKTFAANYAHKKDVKIHSKNLQYIDVIKVVNRLKK